MAAKIGALHASRKVLSALRNTPLHPQWFAFRGSEKRLVAVCRATRGQVLDIGCAGQKPRRYLSSECTYIGLDHYTTASEWYGTKPQVYGNANALPFASTQFDSVFLLDVLEHLSDPDRCLNEITRVLKPGGKLVLQVPFIYPVHDAPLDYQRWTLHGLRTLAQRFEFTILEEKSFGNALESSALLANIAFSKVLLDWIRQWSPLGLLAVLLPPFVVSTNLIAFFLSPFVRCDSFMPHGIRLIMQKH